MCVGQYSNRYINRPIAVTRYWWWQCSACGADVLIMSFWKYVVTRAIMSCCWQHSNLYILRKHTTSHTHPQHHTRYIL